MMIPYLPAFSYLSDWLLNWNTTEKVFVCNRALTDHVVQLVLCFFDACSDSVPWCLLADGRFAEAPGVICRLPLEFRTHIDRIVILFVIYRSGYDLTLGLLAYFRESEVDWGQVNMEEKWFGYQWITGQVTSLEALNTDPKQRRLKNHTPPPSFSPGRIGVLNGRSPHRVGARGADFPALTLRGRGSA